jgi:predicted Zn-dependent protease with MMP-like domain
MTQEEFEEVIIETMERLPPQFRESLENVDIVLEEYADTFTLRSAGVRNREELLGFYHGVPRTARTQGYAMVTPDKISIYRQPILHFYRTPEAVREAIRHTVLHELAHYFGIDDERLRELGAY